MPPESQDPAPERQIDDSTVFVVRSRFDRRRTLSNRLLTRGNFAIAGMVMTVVGLLILGDAIDSEHLDPATTAAAPVSCADQADASASPVVRHERSGTSGPAISLRLAEQMGNALR